MALRTLGITPRGAARPLQVEGIKGLVANLYATQQRVVEHVRRATKRTARQTTDLAKQLAPVDEDGPHPGNLRDSLTYDLSDGGLTFVVYHDPEAFVEDGPYNVFQELGFKHWITGEFIQNAHLFPAFESMKGPYAADISRAARYAIEQTRPQ